METDYLTMDQALQFVQSCEDQDIFIYGVERFTFEEGRYMPDLDGIADFSSLSPNDVRKSASSAKRFLELFPKSDPGRFRFVL